MNRKRIEQFLSLVGSEAANVTSSDWVMAPCPFAPWTHSSGKDSNPSFGIKINDGGPSGYNCLTCNRHADNLILMIMDIAALKEKEPGSGKYCDLRAANKLVEKHEVDVIDPDDIPDYEDKGKDIDDRYIFPEGWIDSFPSAHKVTKAKKYLKKRHVRHKDAIALNLKFDSHRNMVCLPLVGDEGYIGMVGRAISDGVYGGLKHHNYSYQGHRSKNSMMNEGNINWDKPVILVEGMFDFIKMYSVYRNVLGMQGVTVNSRRVKILSKAMELYTFVDSDDAGYRSRQEMRKSLGDIIVEQFVPSKVMSGAKDVDDIPRPILRNFLSDYVRIRHG